MRARLPLGNLAIAMDRLCHWHDRHIVRYSGYPSQGRQGRKGALFVDPGRLVLPRKQEAQGYPLCSIGVDSGAGVPTAGRMDPYAEMRFSTGRIISPPWRTV